MYRSDTSIIAKITIKLEDEILKSIKLALEPEVKTPSSNRSMTYVDVSNGKLVLKTNASDVSALRANLNSYLRWIEGIQGIFCDI